jgi:hypothetical protein
LQLFFGPGLGRDLGDLPVGHLRQTDKHVTEISERVKATPSAVFNNRVNDGTTLTGIRIANEKLSLQQNRESLDESSFMKKQKEEALAVINKRMRSIS